MISCANWLRRDVQKFMVSEVGLVTVEWVALAGAIIIGAIAVGWIVMRSLSSPAHSIGSSITSHQSTKY